VPGASRTQAGAQACRHWVAAHPVPFGRQGGWHEGLDTRSNLAPQP